MIDIEKEREAFLKALIHFAKEELGEEYPEDILTNAVLKHEIMNNVDASDGDEPLNIAYHFWLASAKNKQETLTAYESQFIELAAELDAAKHENCELEDKLLAAHKSRIEFVEYMRKVESSDHVLVPKKCPDPDFADALFLSLPVFSDDNCECSIVNTADIDPEKIWELVLKTAQGESHE